MSLAKKIFSNYNRNLFFYGFLGVATAFVSLFLYVFLPKLYSDFFGVGLATIGAVLIFSRFIDAFLDPLIGYASDKIAKNYSRKFIIIIALFLLLFSYILLLYPIESHIKLWLFFTITLAYLSLSTIIINALSIVPEYSKEQKTRLDLNSAREFFGIIGVFLAIVIPNIFLAGVGKDSAIEFLSYLGLAIFSLTAMAFVFFDFEQPKKTLKTSHNFFKNFSYVVKDREFLYLILINFVNNLTFAITSAVFVFYVSKVLLAEVSIGAYLLTYFVSSFVFIGILSKLSKKYGKIFIWKIALIGSVVSFAGTLFIDHNSAWLFYLVCIFSGAFLGADLFVPPSMLGDYIHKNKKESESGIYSGFWVFNIKLALAIGGGGALLIIGEYGESSEILGLPTISIVYALIPCLLKSATFILLKNLKNARV